MSEEHRLTRRELREQGKLPVRDAATPSLTETSELRLRRPSRRELREAERTNAAAEDRIRNSGVFERQSIVPEFGASASFGSLDLSGSAQGLSGSAQELPSSGVDACFKKTSGAATFFDGDAAGETVSDRDELTNTQESFGAFFGDFHVHEDAVDVAGSAAGSGRRMSDGDVSSSNVDAPSSSISSSLKRESLTAEFESIISDEPHGADTGENIQPAELPLERRSLFERFADSSEDSGASESLIGDIDAPVHSAPSADTAGKDSAPSLEDQLVARTSEDQQDARASVTSEPGYEPEPEPEPELEFEPVDGVTADSPETSDSRGFDELAETDSADMEQIHSNPTESESIERESGTADEPAADEPTESELAEGELAETVADDVIQTDVAATVPAENSVEPVTEPVRGESSKSEASKTEEQKAADEPASKKNADEHSDKDTSDTVTVETAEGSTKLGWLVLLILIVIGALTGYLLGMWITATWLSAPALGSDFVGSSVLML